MKTIKTGRSFLIALGIIGIAGLASASTATITADVTGTPLLVYGMTAFATTGADMVGLQVKVTFTGGATSTAIWAATCGASCGQATNTAGTGSWTLQETNDTGFVTDSTNVTGSALNPWTLTNTTGLGIIAVELTGSGTGIVFDRNRVTGTGPEVAGLQAGTPNSSIGVTFTTTSINPPPADTGVNNPYAVSVTYSNIVQFLGSAQNCQGAAFTGITTATGCGDTWQRVTFAFADTVAGRFTGSTGSPATFHFFQDSDMVGLPEPLSFGLMGSGLLALALYRKRRMTRSSN